ncbi:N/A [soil metagenome]
MKNVLYYVIALLLTGIVVSLKYYYPAILGQQAPFLLFVFVPLTITYIGGFYPGVFSTLLTAIIIFYYFLSPLNSFKLGDMTAWAQITIYILEAFIGVRIIDSLKDTKEELTRIKEHLEQQIEIRTQKIQRASDKLQKLNLELQRSNRELEEFAYIASHDLQEPLRKIQSFSNLLQEEYRESLHGDATLYLDRILNAASRMRKLINDLLEYSRVSRSKHFIQSIDIKTVIVSVLTDLELYIKETHTTITIDDIPKIEADPLLMQQLFQNLIINAIHYRHPERKPIITISAKMTKEKYITISIKDNGIGFDEQYADKIFKIFERLYSKQEKTGTGIGLAICRKIVEQHNGTITAKSKKDIGATFLITLPIHFQKQ